MASLQDIRRRIRSVKSIQQITKAMKMVAAARLRRAQQAAIANKPFAEKMAEIVENVAAHVEGFKHPLLETHAADKELFLIVAADKGLAGAYSSNVFKEAVRHIPDKEKADLVVIGRKTEEHFRNRGYHIVKDYLGISERPKFEHAKEIAAELTNRYESGEYSAVHIVYARFVSSIVNVPERFQLLPFEGIASDEAKEEEPGRIDKAKSFIRHLKLAAMERLMKAQMAKEQDPYRPEDEAAGDNETADKAVEGTPVPAGAAEETSPSAEAQPEPEKDPFAEEPVEETPDSLNLEVYDVPLEEFKEDPYIFEPGADEVLGHLLPQYLVTMIYAAQLQAAASELSSRMTAMSSATDNAQELTRKLDLLYNKVRQANITREITEIVGGAEALK